MKLLVHTSAYTVGRSMGGIGVRIWELGQVLADAGVQIRVLARGAADLVWPRIEFGPPDEPTCREGLAWADAVLVTDLPDTRLLLAAHKEGKLIVAENAVPLEHLDYPGVRDHHDPQEVYDDILVRYRLQVLLSDHFIARSQPERIGLITSLAVSGRLTLSLYEPARTLGHLISLIPIGFNRYSDAYARAQRPDGHGDFLWNGGIWEYLQPTLVLDALDVLASRGIGCTVHFLYPPPADQRLREARRLLEAITARPAGRATATVERDVLPHERRDGRLLAAHGLVCVGKAGIENDTCHRLRLRDVWLYRKPLLIDRDSATGELVERLGVGLAVNRDDPVSLADAMEQLLSDHACHAALVENIDRTRLAVAYEATAAPLLAFLERGAKAPDIGTARHREQLQALLESHPAVAAEPMLPI